MITRLLLSLRKAGASREDTWNLGQPTTHTTMRFAERRGGVSTGDEIRLDTFASTREGSQSQEHDGVGGVTGDATPRACALEDLAT